MLTPFSPAAMLALTLALVLWTPVIGRAGEPPAPSTATVPAPAPARSVEDEALRRKLEAALGRLDRQEERLRRQDAELGSVRSRLDESESRARAASAAPAPPAVTTGIAIGSGLQITAGDAFSLGIRARLQLLFEAQAPTDDAVRAGAPGQTDMGFQIRRLRLVFAGNAFTPKLTYYVQLGFSNRDTESDLRLVPRDACLNYAPLRELQLRVGQMKVPFGKQRVVSSSALQMVDRSTVTSELNLDRDVGVYLWSPYVGGKGIFQYFAGVFGGEGRNRLPGQAGLLYFARVQFMPAGAFDDLAEADLERHHTPKLSIAVSAAYNQATNRQRSTTGNTYKHGTFDYGHAGADLMFKVRGFSLQSELFLRIADKAFVEDETMTQKEYSRSALGYYVQGGYLFNEHFEVSGRWGEYYPLTPTDPKLVRSHEAGGAFSYYFFKHNLKVQADYFYLYSDAPASERHQVRLQAQLFL